MGRSPKNIPKRRHLQDSPKKRTLAIIHSTPKRIPLSVFICVPLWFLNEKRLRFYTFMPGV